MSFVDTPIKTAEILEILRDNAQKPSDELDLLVIKPELLESLLQLRQDEVSVQLIHAVFTPDFDKVLVTVGSEGTPHLPTTSPYSVGTNPHIGRSLLGHSASSYLLEKVCIVDNGQLEVIIPTVGKFYSQLEADKYIQPKRRISSLPQNWPLLTLMQLDEASATQNRRSGLLADITPTICALGVHMLSKPPQKRGNTPRAQYTWTDSIRRYN